MYMQMGTEADERLHIYLFFTIEQHWVEIQVSSFASFHDILQALAQMKIIAMPQRNPAVYERETICECDPDVALYSLNVQNGMCFYVY
jgi:hypothetical protein